MNKYYQIKKQNKSYQILPIEERVKMFLDLATSQEAPGHSVLGLNYMLHLKSAFFTEDELNGKTKTVNGLPFDVEKHIGLLFVFNKEEKKYKIIFAYNPKGYNNAKGFENLDSLTLIEIDHEAKKWKKVSMEGLKQKFDNEEYVQADTISTRKISADNKDLLMAEGRLYVTQTYEGGKAIYDSRQRPTNVTGYILSYLDGTTKHLTPEAYSKGGY